MEKYEKILNSLNTPLIPEENINYSNHIIFQKYTSKIYYKYAFDLLDTLTKKTNYENKKRLLHNAFVYLTYILYNCGNNAYLSNYDLMIFCCFYLSVKVIVKQNTVLGLTKFKKIYEKFSNYKNEEIIKAEIICIKLLKYQINFLTVFDCLYYLSYYNKELFNSALTKFENEKMLNIKEYMNKKPYDLAKEIIHSLDIKVRLKYPKLIKKKIILNNCHFNNNNKSKYQRCTSKVQFLNSNNNRHKQISHNNSKNLIYNKYTTIINSNTKKGSLIFPTTEKRDSIYKKDNSKKKRNKGNILNSSNLVNSFSNIDIELNSSPFNQTNCSSSPTGSDGLSSYVHQNSSGIKLTNNSPNQIFIKPCLDKKNMKTAFIANKKNNRYININQKLDLSQEKIDKESHYDKIKDNYLSCTFYSKRKKNDCKNKLINF